MADGKDVDDRPVQILLVEDDPADAELTIRALREHNLANEVLLLEDGALALDYLLAEEAYEGRDTDGRPKVVFLDLKLPKVDGIEVLRRVRSDERTRTLPVVVLTSSQEERDIVETYRLGVNSYVVKPVDFERFTAAVQQLGLYWLILNQAPAPGR